nr:cyclase family protein [Chloroflexia bacterium]
MEGASGARIYDVSLPITRELPVWPGDPQVDIASASRIARGDVANVSRFSISSHTGTHVDAPWHFIDDGARLADIAIVRWIGPCLVVEIPSQDSRIEPSHLNAITLLADTKRVLFKTSNSALWSESNSEFLES